MHKLRVFSLVGLLGIILLTSCSKTNVNPSVGNWIKREDFGANARSEAVSFVIGGSGYIATGYDFNSNTTQGAQDTTGHYYDLWQYTPNASQDASLTGNWVGSGSAAGPGQTQLDSFPGIGRNSAVAFNIGDTGYVGTGYDGNNFLKDFYAYIPATNVWVRKADFLGSARYDAVGFALQGKGYIATGYDGSYQADCYQYNPSTDTWKYVDQYPGGKCSQAVAFVSNDTTAFVCTGSNNGNTAVCNQLCALTVTPGTTSGITWTRKRHISNFDTQSFDDLYAMVRQNAVAFVMGNFAYLTTGNNGAERVDTWEYDIAHDLWYQETSFEGPAREGAVGFTINVNGVDRGYVGTGRSGPAFTSQFTDFWEFLPTQPYNALD
jgi:N-acetylneuraminic acid mutarotase